MNYETHEKREDTNAGLNPAQQDAATIVDGPALVIAGGGTGKTRTLIARLAHLIRSGIGPGIVLLLTFTRRGSGGNDCPCRKNTRRPVPSGHRWHLSRRAYLSRRICV